MSKENPIIPPLADESGVIKVWPFSQNPDGSLSPSASVGPSSNVNIEYLKGVAPSLDNPLPVELSDGTLALGTAGNPLSVDVVSGGGSNASVGADNVAAPTSDTLIGTVDAGGKLQAVSAANPLPISGSISATNPSVGTDNAAAPTSATEIGSIDGGGKLQGASTTNPIPVALPTATVTTLTPPTAAAIAAAFASPLPVNLRVAAGNTVTGDSLGSKVALAVEIIDAGGNLVVPFAGGQVEVSDGMNVVFGSGMPAYVKFASAQSVNAACTGTVTTTPPSHASTNVDELNGTAVDTNSGNKSAGTLRVVVATDQPNLTTALNVHDASPSAISIASAQKIEVYDGTNTAAVKAGSTAAADADTSLVVQLNPKQPNLDTALNVHDASPSSVAVTNTGTFAVQEATIDGCISASVLAVHDSAPASQAVTNAGTFAVQATTKTALTPAAPTAASVGVASASVVAVNASRKGLILVNTSANVISLGFGNAAVLYSGVTLGPYGTFCMDEYSMSTAAVYAIASGATSNLAIQEYN